MLYLWEYWELKSKGKDYRYYNVSYGVQLCDDQLRDDSIEIIVFMVNRSNFRLMFWVYYFKKEKDKYFD